MDALDRHGRVLCSHDTPPYGPGLAVGPAGALGGEDVAGDGPVDRRVATARRGVAEPFGEPAQNRLDLSGLGLGLGGLPHD